LVCESLGGTPWGYLNLKSYSKLKYAPAPGHHLSQLKFLMNSLVLLHDFAWRQPVQLQVGDEVIMARETKARRARFVEKYANPNTGNPIYVFEYGAMYPNPDVDANPHEWARSINQGNNRYAMYMEK
jgi:hypothetical protein